jgi:hypothetical protein
VEYFTIGHPPVFNTDSPTLLGFGWGIIATWWVGLILGVLLALSARIGPLPTMTAGKLVKSLLVLLAVMAVLAAVAGAIGRNAASSGAVWLLEPLASRVPRDRHVAFITCLWAHCASYLVGFLGGLCVCAVTIVRRALMAREPAPASDRAQAAA